jgi:hypothetical protein
VVGWSLSNSLDKESCLRTFEKAIESHGLPDIVNSDQGSQITSQVWGNVVSGYVDNANALTYIPTKTTTTNVKDSLIFMRLLV